MLSADAKSAVLLRVLSLTKIEVHNFPWLHFPRWLSLVHGQLAMSLRRVIRSIICKCMMLMFLPPRYSTMVSFFLSTTFSVTEIPPRGDSAKCQLLQIFIYQNSKSIIGLDIYSLLEESVEVLLKMFLINVDKLTLPRRPQNVIFKNMF